MKEKIIAKSIVIALAVLFTALFTAQFLLFDFGDNKFVETIKDTIEYAKSGDWDNANKEAEKAYNIWDNGNAIVAIKYSETDFTFLNVYLARFNSAVRQKDASSVEKEGLSAIYIFNNITSIAPKP